MANQVYQFKITLRGIEPEIWRQIQVPEYYTFWDLHVAIQDAMGWTDSHLHLFSTGPAFTPGNNVIGIPHEIDMLTVLPGWKVPIEENFTEEEPDMEYLYDFGDSWVHDVVLEKILPMKKGTKYPKCLAGERECPLDNCGGKYGYQELLEDVVLEPSREAQDQRDENGTCPQTEKRYAELKDCLG